jgi:hypothetical protein
LNKRGVVLAALATVTIVWQVPHTIWLRYILLIALGVAAWPVAAARLARPHGDVQKFARDPFKLLFYFLAWSAVVALMARDPRANLNDLRAEWLAPTLILLAGYGLALRFPERDAIVRVLFLGFVLHAFMQLVTAGYVLARGEEINFFNFGGISDHKANVTYTNTLALAMLVAHAVARARGGEGFLRIDTRYALAAFGLMAASTLVSTTRNGMIIFALLSIVGFVLIARALGARAPRASWAILIACGLVVVVGTVLGLKSDARWSNFIETAPVAWDTDKHKQWIRGERVETDMPLTASGKPVDPSAYYRIAFLREGLRIMQENWRGTRVGRDAFRWAVQAKYGSGGMSHAHNSMIDLGVSLGWIGVLAWSAFMVSFILYASRAREAAGSGLRLALVLVVAAYFARSFLDATVRDHIIQEFMMTAGALVGAIAMAASRERA